jgi:hypothetical protein
MREALASPTPTPSTRLHGRDSSRSAAHDQQPSCEAPVKASPQRVKSTGVVRYFGQGEQRQRSTQGVLECASQLAAMLHSAAGRQARRAPTQPSSST